MVIIMLVIAAIVAREPGILWALSNMNVKEVIQSLVLPSQ